MAVIGVRPIDHPPEALVESSPSVILGGFLIISAVLILVAFMWAARGRSEDGRPDAFGKLIKVHEVAAEYHTSWSPGSFWPSKESHGTAEAGRKSPIFGVVWMFLVSWLVMMGVYLVLAGALTEIEVFREHEHVRASGCVAVSCVLCAIWPVLFRVGSSVKTAKMAAQPGALVKNSNGETTFVVPIVDKSKSSWLWISCVVLGLAWVLALAASAQLQAWTLPGPQFGTLIFFAPGYGLFSGWLLYATFLNIGVAMSFDSYPDGTRAMPADGSSEFIHRYQRAAHLKIPHRSL